MNEQKKKMPDTLLYRIFNDKTLYQLSMIWVFGWIITLYTEKDSWISESFFSSISPALAAGMIVRIVMLVRKNNQEKK